MDLIQKNVQKLQLWLDQKGLYDIRVLALIGVGLLAITIFWNGAKIVQQNFELAQKVAAIQQENEILELENRNKELKNQYLQTDEFAEITARRVFGKASPGERVYIVPKETALNALGEQIVEESTEEQTQKPQWQQNLESWLNIYFGN